MFKVPMYVILVDVAVTMYVDQNAEHKRPWHHLTRSGCRHTASIIIIIIA